MLDQGDIHMTDPNTGADTRSRQPASPKAHASLVAQAEAMSADGTPRKPRAYRRYLRLLRLSRFALAAFVLLGVLFLLWTLPWLPSGFDVNDYTPELAFTVCLVGGLAIAGFCALMLQELARRRREKLIRWSSILDENMGVRNRQDFYDRLTLECERAAHNEGTFSVLIIHVQLGTSEQTSLTSLPADSLRKLAYAIDGLTHPTDVIALLGGGQLGLLATGVSREDRAALAARLKEAVSAELPAVFKRPADFVVKAGAATYGPDGADARGLVDAARTAAIFKSPVRTNAA
jgi:GGDEF domain-containing protein